MSDEPKYSLTELAAAIAAQQPAAAAQPATPPQPAIDYAELAKHLAAHMPQPAAPAPAASSTPAPQHPAPAATNPIAPPPTLSDWSGDQLRAYLRSKGASPSNPYSSEYRKVARELRTRWNAELAEVRLIGPGSKK